MIEWYYEHLYGLAFLGFIASEIMLLMALGFICCLGWALAMELIKKYIERRDYRRRERQYLFEKELREKRKKELS